MWEFNGASFPTDVCIVFLFGALILEEETMRKGFFPYYSVSLFQLPAKGFEVLCTEFIVQNDSTVNSGLLTVLLLFFSL